MEKTYHHLTCEERSLIQVSLELGQTQAEIARSLERPKVVSAENLNVINGLTLRVGSNNEVAPPKLAVIVLLMHSNVQTYYLARLEAPNVLKLAVRFGTRCWHC